MARPVGGSWGTAVLTAILVALAACGDDGGAAGETTTTTSSTTTTTEASPTTTTEPVDPTTVPDEITKPYVQAVLDELYAIEGEAIRLAVEEGLVTGEVLDLLDTALASARAESVANQLIESAVDGFPGVRRPPGVVGAMVEEVLSGREDCVYAEVIKDFSEVNEDPIAPQSTFVLLWPSEDPRSSVPWVIAGEGFNEDGSVPPDPCEAQA